MTVVFYVATETSGTSCIACRTDPITDVWSPNYTSLLHSWTTMSLTKRTDLKLFAIWALVRGHM